MRRMICWCAMLALGFAIVGNAHANGHQANKAVKQIQPIAANQEAVLIAPTAEVGVVEAAVLQAAPDIGVLNNTANPNGTLASDAAGNTVVNQSDQAPINGGVQVNNEVVLKIVVPHDLC